MNFPICVTALTRDQIRRGDASMYRDADPFVRPADLLEIQLRAVAMHDGYEL